jgi:transcriptional regulator with XRE-family HTH domain
MNQLKQIMRDRGMSQNQLAYDARVPQGSISLIVNEKLYPCPAWRKRIAEVMGMPEDALFPNSTLNIFRTGNPSGYEEADNMKKE